MAAVDHLKVLENAFKAHDAGDFLSALNFYEHFFDHALDDDPYELYALRFSHALTGWAELATVFPGAKYQLERKASAVWDDYLEHKNPERFFDYLSICRHLGIEQEALNRFLELQTTQAKSAAKLARYVWDDLILAEQWRVCSELMPMPAQKIDELFSIFKESDRLRQVDPQFDKPEYDAHIVDTLLNDVQKVAQVLRHSSRADELKEVQRQFVREVEHTGHGLLAKQAHARAAFLFAGH